MTSKLVPQHGSGGIVVPPVSWPITLTQDQYNDILDEIASAGRIETAKRDKRIAELEAALEPFARLADKIEQTASQDACEQMGQRIANLESLLHDVDAVLEFVWPHFGGDDADRIGRIQKRVIDAVSN